MIGTIVLATNGTASDLPVQHVANAMGNCVGSPQITVAIAALDAARIGHFADPVVVCAPEDANVALMAVDSPVMVAGPACASPIVAIEQLVVGVDEHAPFSDVVRVAAEMAAGCGLRCWLVGVVPGVGLQEAEWLESVASELNRAGVEVGWDIVTHDDPARALVEFARTMPASVVVCGAPPAGQLGAVGEQLVREAPGPVLVVRASAAQTAQAERDREVAHRVD
ncbi:MAG: universal stress protein [Acidimicrobiia bacterium]